MYRHVQSSLKNNSEEKSSKYQVLGFLCFIDMAIPPRIKALYARISLIVPQNGRSDCRTKNESPMCENVVKSMQE